MFLGGSKKGKTIFLCSVDLVVQGNNFLAPKEGGSDLVLYRFSAFWLRSKCSICSYQLNIPHFHELFEYERGVL